MKRVAIPMAETKHFSHVNDLAKQGAEGVRTCTYLRISRSIMIKIRCRQKVDLGFK